MLAMRWQKKKIKEIQSEFAAAADHRIKPRKVRWGCGKMGKANPLKILCKS